MKRYRERVLCVILLCGWTLGLSGCVEHKEDIPPVPGATQTYEVYVADSGTNDVAVLDPSGKIVKTIPVGRTPSAIAFDAPGTFVPKHVYIANKGDNTVTVLNAADNSVAATIPVGLSPTAIAFIGNTGTNDEIFVVNSADGTVSRINIASLTVTATYKTGRNPIAVALEHAEFGVLNADDATITVVSNTLQKTTALIPVQGTPIGLDVVNGEFTAASADGLLQPFDYDLKTGQYDAQPVFNTGAPSQHAMALDSTHWALVNSQAGTLAIYDTFFKKIGQTLTAGTAPMMAAAYVTSDSVAPLNVYVPNKGSDSVSWFAGPDDFDKPLTAKTPIALAKGAQPVAVGFYTFWVGGSPSPSTSPSTSPSASPSTPPTASPSPTPTPTATPAANHLYVADFAGSVVQYAPPFGSTSVPAATFSDTTPVGGPIGIAANATYVVTSHVTGSVSAYQQPVNASSTPVASFGGSAFGLMSFDARGNLWATSQNSSVVEYVPPFTNSTVEAVSLTNGFTSSYGIAFDASGNLYVTNSDSSANIVVYAPPYTSLTKTYAIPTPNANLHGLAVYGSKLYVADTRNNLIYIYALPMSTNNPSDAFSASAPLGLAFDANGTLYVTTQGTNQVQIFNPPFNSGSTPAATITSGVNQANGIAVGP